jgi:hypothetical protein
VGQFEIQEGNFEIDPALEIRNWKSQNWTKRFVHSVISSLESTNEDWSGLKNTRTD